MKKAAQLAVLVLVMLAGLYSFDYVAGSASRSGTFTGAVTISDSDSASGSSQQELCAVEEFLGTVICTSGNPKKDYGSKLGLCNAECKPAGTANAAVGSGSQGTTAGTQAGTSGTSSGSAASSSSATLGGAAGSPDIKVFRVYPTTIVKGDTTMLAWAGIVNADLCEILANEERIKSPNNGYIKNTEFAGGAVKLAPEKTTDYQIRCLKATESGLLSPETMPERVTVTSASTITTQPSSSSSAVSGASGSAAKERCEISTAQGKVICTSGNPKKDYGSKLGLCNAECRPAAGTAGAGSQGTVSVPSSTTSSSSAATGSASSGTQAGAGSQGAAASSSEAANLVVGGLGLGRDANVMLSISNMGKKRVSGLLAVAASIKKDGVVVCTGEGDFSNGLDAGRSAAVVASMKGSTGAQCSLQAGQGYHVEGTVDSKSQIPETDENDNTKSMPLTFLAASSAFKCTAYTVGFRTQEGTYCDADGNGVAQKAGAQACGNNFECSSNFCAAGQCIESSIVKKMFCSLGAASLC